MSKARNEPEGLKTRVVKARAAGEDDVEGHGLMRNAPEGLKTRVVKARAAGEDDVEGHSLNARITPGEGLTSRTRVTDDSDVEGHWMPDAGSSMRLAKARNSDIERDARQHQLANDARQARIDHDPKRSHQKG